jgi:hypothetical protein
LYNSMSLKEDLSNKEVVASIQNTYKLLEMMLDCLKGR